MYIHEIGRIDAEPYGARRHRANAVRRAFIARRNLVRQELREMRADRHRTDARSAAAVRNAEGLVQVQVRDVAAELARRGQADHRVHVRAVHIHLAAVRVHDLADFAHVLLEHAVRGRIRDHDRRELVGVLLGLRLQVFDIDVALRVARHHDHLHAGHLRRRRVRAVRRSGNQADVAMRFAARRVIRVDDQQAGVFALRAGVRLQRHGRVAGGRDQHLLRADRSFRGSRRSARPARTDGSGRTRAT